MSRPLWARPKILILEIALFAAFVASFAVIPLFGWRFAVILTVLVLAHEAGHIWALHHYGIGLKGFFFIPFMGAIVVPESNEFPSDTADAWVSLMGPLWGFGSALVAMGLWHITGNKSFLEAAFYAVIINLFNLDLLFPIDGGRMMRCFSHMLSPFRGLLLFAFLNLISLAPIALVGWLPFYAAQHALMPRWLIGVNIFSLVLLLAAVSHGAYSEWRDRALLIWYKAVLVEEKKSIPEQRFAEDPAGGLCQKLDLAAALYRRAEEMKIGKKQFFILLATYLGLASAFVLLLVKLLAIIKS
ncbi:MAG: site-2 protease family protein [Patescibacteria group bacterium]